VRAPGRRIGPVKLLVFDAQTHFGKIETRLDSRAGRVLLGAGSPQVEQRLLSGIVAGVFHQLIEMLEFAVDPTAQQTVEKAHLSFYRTFACIR